MLAYAWPTLWVCLFVASVMPSASFANTCEAYLMNTEQKLESPSGISGYFLMTRKFRNRQFADIARVLPDLSAMGVNAVWISPPNPQTEAGPPRFTWNDHGYWVSDHGAVDPEAGGEAGFADLVKAGQTLGVDVMIDVPLDQFGYGQTFQIGGQTVDARDARYFVDQTAFPEIVPTISEDDLWRKIDENHDPILLRALAQTVSSYPYLGLPKLRHRNPEVARYLIESYKRYIDRGVDLFRIDSAKRVPTTFLADWINALSDYGAQQNRRPKFLGEFLMSSQRSLNFYFNEVRQRLHDKDSLYLIDFPMAIEFRRLLEPSYRFAWLKGFMSYRESSGISESHLIPMVEDHDSGERILDSYLAKLIYATTEFFSVNPTILFHGSERSGMHRAQREQLENLEPAGDIANLRFHLGVALNRFRLRHNEVHTGFLEAGDDILVAQKSLPTGETVVLMANKGNVGVTRTVSGTDFAAISATMIGGAILATSAEQAVVQLPPHSLVVIAGRTLPPR